MEKKKKLCRLLIACLIASIFNGKIFFLTSQAAVILDMDGLVAAETVKVKKIAGGKANVKSENGVVISLPKGKKVTIKSQLSKDGVKWYKINFKYKKVTYQGYVKKKKITTVITTSSVSKQEKKGKVNASFLNVRTGAGVSNDTLKYEGDSVALERNTNVTILSEDNSTGELWYQISFEYAGEELTGFVSGQYILLQTQETSSSSSEEENNNIDIESKDTETEDTLTTTTGNSIIGTIWNEKEFETAITEQGFPESYKPYLRELHKKHPTWIFYAYNTELSWDTVIEKESKVGRNLIPKSKNIAWKSLEQGAYDWTSDTFIVFDGTTWVSASEAIIKYYMDPRNFMDETGIYQFELLSYNDSYQTLSGVEAILNNTPMSNHSYQYNDPETESQEKITYANTFLKAAEISGVSPYHLASRVRQEVVTSSTTFSNSATGTYSGYQGYYNFYNIGANDSAGGGAIEKGLTYAKKTNSTYLLPWTSPYHSIVGGAIYIGKSYINKGQNTLYLEKFNVTENSTYNHQYMTNVEAANSEAQKISSAYQEMGELPLIFSIPVYTDMPETACPIPEDMGNPNHWLKKLSITGHTLTPTFEISNDFDTVYSLIVDNSVDSIKINATAVNTAASISGIGKQTLEVGTNTFIIKVTAENGDIREYTIKVVRNK